jgi:hypothetical protein
MMVRYLVEAALDVALDNPWIAVQMSGLFLPVDGAPFNVVTAAVQPR